MEPPETPGRFTSYAEDSLGRTVSSTDPLGHTTGYTYDGAGDVLATTDPAGAVTTSSYNNNGQEISRNYSSSAMHAVTETYNPAGMRTSMADGTGTTHRQEEYFRKGHRLTILKVSTTASANTDATNTATSTMRMRDTIAAASIIQTS
jgi:YD repeat-containing protein